MKTPKIDLYQDKSGGWRWRLVAANGRIVADSGEAYVRKAGAIKAIERMRELAVVAEGPDTPFAAPMKAGAAAFSRELN